MHFTLAKGLLSSRNSMNIYRGCTHGCIYCDSRSKCYQIKHDFEDIEVKKNAITLLEQELYKKRKKGMIGTGAMTDPYIHLEEKLEYTKQALQLIYKYGFGVTVHTKSNRILRDLELLKQINERTRVVVQMTLTTYDENLCRIIEPNVSTSKERYEALKIFQEHNIPTVVWLDPILPFINDTFENIKGILDYCIDAGVKGIVCFGMGLTLREGNREYFYKKLDQHFPGLKQQYINRYQNSYEVSSPKNKELMKYVIDTCKKHDIMIDPNEVFSYIGEFTSHEQLSLF